MPERPREPGFVPEPVQVYLTRQDRALLDRIAKATKLSRAEVLRRGLHSIAASVLAEAHPVLMLLDEMAKGDWPATMPRDAAERHDQYLAQVHTNTHEPEGA